MIKTSVFMTLFKAFYEMFLKSKTYLIIEKTIDFLSVALSGTFFMRIMRCAGRELKREGSVFYNILKRICDIVFSLAKGIYIAAKGSILFKGISFFFGSSKIFQPESFLLIGLFVIFVCPHQIWNNAFGLIFALLCVMLYFVAASKGERVGKNARRIWLPFILFGMALLLSVMISADVADSVRVLMFFVTSFILCLVTFGTLTDAEKFDKMCGMVFLSLILTGAVAVGQKILGIEVDALLTDTNLNGNMPGRAFSTWANPNNFAEFLIIFFPFCFSFAVTRESIKGKTIALLALLIPFAALLFTYSRSGWLGFLVVAVTFVVLYNKKLLPAIVLIGILLIPMLPSSVLDRIMTIGNLEDTSSSYRIDIWTGAIKMLGEYWHRGTGLGPGAFAQIYPDFAVASSAEAPHTHMLFMEVFAEMGILGLFTFSLLIICLIARTTAAAKRCESGRMKLYSISAASAMMGILTIGFAEYVWFYPRVMFAFFVAIGMAMAAVKLSGAKND